MPLHPVRPLSPSVHFNSRCPGIQGEKARCRGAQVAAQNSSRFMSLKICAWLKRGYRLGRTGKLTTECFDA